MLCRLLVQTQPIRNNLMAILMKCILRNYTSNFYDEINDLFNKERQDSSKQTYTPNNEYTIHKIGCYEDAMKYAKYTNWCISKSGLLVKMGGEIG